MNLPSKRINGYTKLRPAVINEPVVFLYINKYPALIFVLHSSCSTSVFFRDINCLLGRRLNFVNSIFFQPKMKRSENSPSPPHSAVPLHGVNTT